MITNHAASAVGTGTRRSPLATRPAFTLCLCGLPLLLLLFPAGGMAQADQSPPQDAKQTAPPAPGPMTHPPIYGIASVTIAAPSDTDGFYSRRLALAPEGDVCSLTCISLQGVNPRQHVELTDREPSDIRGNFTHNYILQVAFETFGVQALHLYLESKGLSPSAIFNSGPDNSNPEFSVSDPDGHNINFIQTTHRDPYRHRENQVGARLIHVGFVVHDRAAMEKFYEEILGFHVYWHGGMKDDETSWLDLQVPNGTDWVEFMLGVPADADKRTLGIMNHIALGVPDIHAAARQLLKNGMKLSEEPKIGRDGKWQLNLYDPDQTRVELMEFTPAEKPCCSDYSGPHPQP